MKAKLAAEEQQRVELEQIKKQERDREAKRVEDEKMAALEIKKKKEE
jgi:nucleoporin GLE1